MPSSQFYSSLNDLISKSARLNLAIWIRHNFALSNYLVLTSHLGDSGIKYIVISMQLTCIINPM
jgi:hypothetical protein